MFRKKLTESEQFMFDRLLADKELRDITDKWNDCLSVDIYRALMRRKNVGDVIVIRDGTSAELKWITKEMEDGKYKILFEQAESLCEICGVNPDRYTFYLCIGKESEKTVQTMQGAESNFFWATIGCSTYLAVANKEEV